jgi:antitoxin (DNA-binding transcriptional repressor) of toxin-antitoxin stability system
VRAGKTVELRDRDRVFARIVPEKQEERPVQYPDFAARRKKIFGDRVLPIVDDVIKDRGRY